MSEIKEGILVVLLDSSLFPLCIVEERASETTWRVRGWAKNQISSFKGFEKTEETLYPLIEIPPEDRELSPDEAFYKHRHQIITKLIRDFKEQKNTLAIQKM